MRSKLKCYYFFMKNTQELDHEEHSEALDILIDAWPRLKKNERKAIFRRIPRTDAEELFLKLQARDQAELLMNLEHLEKRSWLRMLALDDAADLLQQLPKNLQVEALDLLDDPSRGEVAALLAYAEDVAGGLMNSRYFRLRPTMTGDEALGYLRAQAKTSVEAIYYAYVLDEEQKLLGIVTFRDILVAGADKLIKDIMQTNIITVAEDLNQEELSRKFANYHVMALPVVDRDNHMKGIVSVNDIVDVVREVATEDIQKLGGSSAFSVSYLKISFLEMIKKRAGWLTILFAGEMLTATAMGYYENEISRAVVLALFIPLIISSGGNSGSQASTLIIRAMALHEARLNDWWRVLGREIVSGLALGIILGAIGMLRILLWPGKEIIYGEHYFLVALTVAFSLVGVVLWGATAGSMLPFLLKRIGFDPATASAPFVATLVDVTGLIIYFTIATQILSGTLL